MYFSNKSISINTFYNWERSSIVFGMTGTRFKRHARVENIFRDFYHEIRKFSGSEGLGLIWKESLVVLVVVAEMVCKNRHGFMKSLSLRVNHIPTQRCVMLKGLKFHLDDTFQFFESLQNFMQWWKRILLNWIFWNGKHQSYNYSGKIMVQNKEKYLQWN